MSSLSSEQDTSLMSFDDYVRSLCIYTNEIESATNNFADENFISQNTFYQVYKGQLSHSGELIDIVARKCLQRSVATNEIMMSKDIKHKNIVSIFKCWYTDFIISKHEANESLDKYLSGSTLTWIQRLHICVCIADALRYIHNIKDDECVIHGNIKSSHILLDHNWEPKLKGFGFAIRGKKHHLHLISEYKGSIEYMDPAYERTGGLTHKSDVFSFGVVFFEVLFGRKADGKNWDFARLARSHYKAGTLDAMINSDLRQQMNEHSLKIFLDTAYFCLNEGGALRPDMDQIFKKLQEALELQQMHESYVRSSNHLKVNN
ncbi:kinase-like domain-containing protein [Tanacetum coccineum]